MALAHIACLLYGGEMGDALPIVVPDRYKKQISVSRCRQILFSMAYHANASDVSFPSAATLGKGWEMDESKVRVALRVLEQPPNSYLLRVGGYKVGHHGVKYQLCLPDFDSGDVVVGELQQRQGTERGLHGDSHPDTQAYDKGEVKAGRGKNKLKPKLSDLALVMFDEFWEAYPRKERREKALEQWAYAASEVDPQIILDAVPAFAEEVSCHDEEFIALASNWLRDKRWEDER